MKWLHTKNERRSLLCSIEKHSFIIECLMTLISPIYLLTFSFVQALTAEVIKTIRDIIAMNPLYRYSEHMCFHGNLTTPLY